MILKKTFDEMEYFKHIENDSKTRQKLNNIVHHEAIWIKTEKEIFLFLSFQASFYPATQGNKCYKRDS